jgi:hypothetical protein
MKDKTVLILAGGAVLGAMYLSHKAKETAKAVGHAVNPLNNDNVFYGGVNAVGESITGRKDWNLGVQIYEWTHPDEQF